MNAMKNVLVVGFGMIGCRHVQSLLQRKKEMNVYVLEPVAQMIESGLARIGAVKADCTWYSAISEIEVNIDVAIVATSSAPRHSIVFSLIEKGIKHFLLEKVVFQSEEQFDNIVQIANKNAVKLYCNFVNRYFKPYNDIKEYLHKNNSTKIRMTVIGGAFGLGCNAIHYIDVFQYITGNNEIKITTADVSVIDIENRRGSQYREFTGGILAGNQQDDSIFVIADKDFQGGVVISIAAGDKIFTLSEQTQQVYEVDSETARQSIFEIIPTSRLSGLIVDEILSGKCRLTTLFETRSAHFQLFKIFNHALTGNHSSSMICPIT
jgi:predicted dehydrogenase